MKDGRRARGSRLRKIECIACIIEYTQGFVPSTGEKKIAVQLNITNGFGVTERGVFRSTTTVDQTDLCARQMRSIHAGMDGSYLLDSISRKETVIRRLTDEQPLM